MKKTILLLALFLFCYVLSQGQTKVIAHKSHSGSIHTFTQVYAHNKFDINRSNFGLPDTEKIILFDTIIAINDSLTILKKRVSNSCFPYGVNYKSLDLKNIDYITKTDTLFHHKIMFKNNHVATIKSFWSARYKHRWNPYKNVVFIGFKE